VGDVDHGVDDPPQVATNGGPRRSGATGNGSRMGRAALARSPTQGMPRSSPARGINFESAIEDICLELRRQRQNRA
jgi:hypothetical protein